MWKKGKYMLIVYYECILLIRGLLIPPPRPLVITWIALVKRATVVIEFKKLCSLHMCATHSVGKYFHSLWEVQRLPYTFRGVSRPHGPRDVARVRCSVTRYQNLMELAIKLYQDVWDKNVEFFTTSKFERPNNLSGESYKSKRILFFAYLFVLGFLFVYSIYIKLRNFVKLGP